MWHELSETLLALIGSLDPAEGSGLTITAADLDVPLEVSAGLRGRELVFLASPPFTRWKSGVLPAVHMAHFSVEAFEAEDEADQGGSAADRAAGVMGS